ncbi:methylmalonyl-CoA mutase family protein [Undibacterium sp. RTI2.1]|uniref:fused isobutyryl-CoA mutase/GTPase IcmF n=1 Tax=unclassified Undibacterium TaxID=2630295 RepID=UPI002AB36657|nr:MULTISPECIES: fused isobutyryl-CoA mutase/GTPase IcmF [unclassified Undibacterium]MDY7539576.1 methylmalonyl-CoA mutase family protein [Undibacterium sp. 5I1]MEB0030121.1 methylmalonyl-CoA mutase family protein [Undibacterium sp. RTI2.1]MEB0116649.1 methylmalonyl-CoA mutase family protein [Undibacterium sp. RTI2.2]MEB0230474.1 methylmalonyl-CoA mutase family protein [Undibacterium sp. 10I3]MEB0258464.1 methylmalonyl-CoA mutase family protein [Undibacterium sp. 5I1]
MTDLSIAQKLTEYKPANKVRFVTAASLFDGHDASINIMRRILMANGAEVIHLGHNRSVEEIVTAALQEDAQGIAISSYQGGHVEYFKYMIDLLRQRGGAHIKVFGGGGGVIVPDEIADLHAYGVARIFSPEDGQRLGLVGMILSMIQACDTDLSGYAPTQIDSLQGDDMVAKHRPLAQLITALENDRVTSELRHAIQTAADNIKTPAFGITGTGGAGKSSLTDELIRRIRLDQDDQLNIALISIDPSRRKSGGALLGDRIRMNAISPWGGKLKVFMRSLATREAGSEISQALPDVIAACKVAGFDLIIVETSGIGQGDAAIVPHVDLSMYVMTPEFGAASQLEKIDMLDFADFVAINKFDRKGALDALRDVAKQYQRNRELWTKKPEEMPVYGTQASRFNDDGVTALYQGILPALTERGLKAVPSKLVPVNAKFSSGKNVIVPPARSRYLAEIADTVRHYHKHTGKQVAIARERQQLQEAKRMLAKAGKVADFDDLITERDHHLDAESKKLITMWPDMQAAYAGDEYVVKIRDKEIRTQLVTSTLSGTKIRKVALPRFVDHGEILRWLMLENVPGSFPFTAGVFAFKREGEDPTRMFAGEGDPFRTNKRFKLVSQGMPAKRLSTAFDSVTLYGADPAIRPDIYGKVGNSGVSVATLEDMKVLYDGFDLCDPATSVSMTINGPAPTILAFFMNTAIDQQMDKFRSDNKREPTADEAAKIRAWVLMNVRGTVQADILKEDQGQNTCIFSTEFSLKVMGDIQEYFVHHQVRNFYSVSISGYHIAEAGANPISQLAFTMSNGFTFVEAYLARGMHIDDFAANLSFFFSNGMDPEYTVLGRVARRIWAVAMRDKYGANDRSQKLKYHIQTSGRSLHAQEIDFNDIRTTLQALIAIYDNCNSLHTNAYDEAITTPTDESVRRALAIQLIINREWGLAKNENPIQGSFIIEELTDLVEEAVMQEFERIAERGGVLGAMETGYQRGKIQEESMHYEHLKHDGTLPIIGVNTFRNPKQGETPQKIELARSTDEEKQSQLTRLADFHQRHAKDAPQALAALQQAAINDENVFAKLMDAARVCSLGQITTALFEVGGQYRRNM